MLSSGSRSARRRTLPFALALLLLPAAASAQAPAPPSVADKATARELAKEGTAALARKDYAEAADRFSRAGTLVHAPTLTLGLARAQVGLGKWLVALDLYNRILQEGSPAGSPPAFVRARQDARRDLDDLEPRVPSVVITVKGAARSVTLDGAPVPAVALGVKRPVDPGKHVIRAEGDGVLPAEVEVTVAERKVETVTLELKAPPPAVAPRAVTPPPFALPPFALPPVAPPPVVSPATPPLPVEPVAGGARPGSVQRTVGFVGLGVGGALTPPPHVAPVPQAAPMPNATPLPARSSASSAGRAPRRAVASERPRARRERLRIRAGERVRRRPRAPASVRLRVAPEAPVAPGSAAAHRLRILTRHLQLGNAPANRGKLSIAMPQETRELLTSVLQLPHAVRAHFAHEILASLDGPEDADARELWRTEIQRRAEEVLSGRAQLEDAEVVHEQLAARLRAMSR